MAKQGHSDNYLGLKTGDVVKNRITGEIRVIRGLIVIDDTAGYAGVIIGDYDADDKWASTFCIDIDDFQNKFDVIEA